MRGSFGAKVKCTGYLIRLHDGIFLSRDGDFVSAMDSSGKVIKELDAWEGSGIEKTYYEFKPAPFRGIVIGWRDVTVKAIIGTDTDYSPYRGEYQHFFKSATETTPCYVVAYANNKKHLVPINCAAKES